MTTYTVISQNTDTGKIEETATYPDFEYARIHYDALSIWNSNRLIKNDNNLIKVLEETA